VAAERVAATAECLGSGDHKVMVNWRQLAGLDCDCLSQNDLPRWLVVVLVTWHTVAWGQSGLPFVRTSHSCRPSVRTLTNWIDWNKWQSCCSTPGDDLGLEWPQT